MLPPGLHNVVRTLLGAPRRVASADPSSPDFRLDLATLPHGLEDVRHILDLALRLHDPEENALQVLLLTDGEMPQPESYDEALAAEHRQRAKRDLTAWLLALVLVGVVLDLHVLARGRGGDPTFRLDAIGRPPGKKSASSAVALVALVALLPLSCGEGGLAELFGGSVWKAHRANEEGIQRDLIGPARRRRDELPAQRRLRRGA